MLTNGYVFTRGRLMEKYQEEQRRTTNRQTLSTQLRGVLSPFETLPVKQLIRLLDSFCILICAVIKEKNNNTFTKILH